MPYDGDWPIEVITGIYSLFTKHRTRDLECEGSQRCAKVCVSPRARFRDCFFRKVLNDFPEAGSFLLQRKARKVRETLQSLCSAHLTLLLEALTADASITSHPGLGSFLSWYPIQNTFLISTLRLVISSSLCLPPSVLPFMLLAFTSVAVPPTQLSQSHSTPSLTDAISTFATCLYSPLNAFWPSRSPVLHCSDVAQHNYTERDVLLLSRTTWTEKPGSPSLAHHTAKSIRGNN